MLLLLLLLLPDVGSSETEPGVFFKTITKCPRKGYFFDQDQGAEFSPCYICFCNKGEQALCRKKEAGGCNDSDYYHQKRITRTRKNRYRRSFGFADLFFKDAAREVLTGNMIEKEECKPLQDSKSIGCPPVDWCTGCMVCDCDAKGHWDCHLMSFCSTDKPENKTKTPKTKTKPRAIPKEARPKKKFALKRLKNAKKNQTNDNTKNKKLVTTKNEEMNTNMVGKAVKRYLMSDAISGISVITKTQFETKKGQNLPLIVRRYVSTNSPIKSPELLKYKSDPRKIAQMLFRQFMLNKIPKNNQHLTQNVSKKNKSNLIKQSKRNSRKPVNTKGHKDTLLVVSRQKKKDIQPESKRIRKTKNSKVKKYKGTKYLNKRDKRDVTSTEDVKITTTEEPGNVTNIMRTDTSDITANPTVYDELITKATEISFTNNEVSPTHLTKYAYVIDKYDDTTRMHDSQLALEKSENNIIMSMNNLINSTAKEYNTIGDQTMATEATIKNGTNFNKTTTEMDQLKTNSAANDITIKLQDSNENRFSSSSDVESTSKIITTVKKMAQTPDNKSTRTKINNTLHNIQAVLEKFIHGVSKNVSRNKPKKKNFTALRYLRKLFAKIFSHARNKTAIDKISVIDSLCENFGPCRVNIKKMGIINSKVKKLMTETEKALNSIKIIKGLLELIENKKSTERNATSKEAILREHVKKLNAILKNDFVPDDQLTQTQATQINYIKSNTHVFIKSIAKFATTLNDIINLIKSENEKDKHNPKSTKSKKRNYQQRDAIQNIKNMLVRYNLLQNNFFQKMYDALDNIEDKLHKRKNNKKIKYEVNVQHDNSNVKKDIDNYINNINYNLNKLKDIISRFGPKNRRKRHTMKDDDAIEYLLTLMEYLLKRNNPLDTPPVNDGIDLLIDAIRNAPDIKPIKKKVKYLPTTTLAEIENSTELNEDASIPKINSNDSNEVPKSTAKYKSEEETVDNDLISGEARIIKDFTLSSNDTTTEKHAMTDLSNLFTEYPSKVYMATYDVYENTDPPFFERNPNNEATTVSLQSPTTEKTDSKKIDDTLIIDENNRNLHMFHQKTMTDLKNVTQGESDTVVPTTESVKSRHYSHIFKDHIEKRVKEPKTKLDLINEAYEEEIKEEKIKQIPVTSPQYHNQVKGEAGKRNKTMLSKKVAGSDVSSISKEETDRDKDTRNQGDVIYRKQMDLLNSLDYGTEKSIADDSDSKDSSPLDRISNDLFPNYFV